MKRILLALVAIAWISGSCHKGKEILKRWEILRNHKWKLVSQTINDVQQPLDECEADNYWAFKGDEYGYEANVTCGDTQVVVGDTTNNTNGTDTTIKRPAHKASANPAQIDFLWSVTGDQRYCYIHDFGVPGHDIDWFIESMDDTKFHVSGNYKVNGVNYVFHRYFEALN